MKRTIITMSIALTILGACREESIPSIEKYNEANVKNYIQLTGFNTKKITGKEVEQEPGSVSIGIFEVTIHRASRDCLSGFGFCNFEWFPDFKTQKMTISESEDKIVTNFYEENGKHFFIIYIKNKVPNDLPTDLLNLQVDENIIKNVNSTTLKTLTIQKGFYKYEKNIGQFGGYKVEVIAKN